MKDKYVWLLVKKQSYVGLLLIRKKGRKDIEKRIALPTTNNRI